MTEKTKSSAFGQFAARAEAEKLIVEFLFAALVRKGIISEAAIRRMVENTQDADLGDSDNARVLGEAVHDRWKEILEVVEQLPPQSS